MRIDMLRGSVDITAAVAPKALYTLPFVTSIEAPDSVDGTRAEVLTDLARAELTTAKHRAPLARSRSWTAYLVQIAGRTVLVGRGTRGREVALRLPSAQARPRTEHLRADAGDGTYAVDLGKLSNREQRAVARALRGAVMTSRPSKAAAPAHSNAPTEVRAEVKHADSSIPGLVLSGMILLLLVGAGVAVHLRRAKPEASP